MARVHIGGKLRFLRMQAGMTQKQLAKALGVHWRSIQDWEANRAAMDSFKASALLAAVEGIAQRPARQGRRKS